MSDLAFRVDEIVCQEITGHKRFEYIEPKLTDYLLQKRAIKTEFGITLPEWKRLEGFGNRLDLKLLCTDIDAFLRFSDSSWLHFHFWPGFITDLASVPRMLRNLVENGDVRLLIAVLIHDYLFTTHALPFAYANELLYQVAIHSEYPKPRAAIAYIGVSSPVGHVRWRKAHQRRDDWTRRYAEMRMPRPITIDGVEYDDIRRLA